MLLPLNTRRCACFNEILTFNCTIVGDGTTLWNGTAFVCVSDFNEIPLRHDNFGTPSGAGGSCTGGRLIGRSLSSNNNCFTSELLVNASAELNNKTIRCIHRDSQGQMVPVGEVVLTIISRKITNCIPIL